MCYVTCDRSLHVVWPRLGRNRACQDAQSDIESTTYHLIDSATHKNPKPRNMEVDTQSPDSEAENELYTSFSPVCAGDVSVQSMVCAYRQVHVSFRGLCQSACSKIRSATGHLQASRPVPCVSVIII